MRPWLFALVFLGACATPQSTEARYRQGSLLHAFGAALSVTGGLGVAGATVAFVAAEDSQGDHTPALAAGAVSALLLGIGVYLVSSGNEHFGPADREPRPENVPEAPPPSSDDYEDIFGLLP